MDIFKKPVEPKRKKRPPGRAPLWTQEFMYMVASKVVDEGMKYREAAEMFGVSHGSINAWRKAYQAGKLGPGSKEPQNETLGVRNHRLQEHILELKAEIGDLYLQNQLLKKAIVTSRQRKKENSSVITSDNLDQFQKGAK